MFRVDFFYAVEHSLGLSRSIGYSSLLIGLVVGGGHLVDLLVTVAPGQIVVLCGSWLSVALLATSAVLLDLFNTSTAIAISSVIISASVCRALSLLQHSLLAQQQVSCCETSVQCFSPPNECCVVCVFVMLQL